MALSATLAHTVELDREGIERRDFPIARRGYDPAAVDAHLSALAGKVGELAQRAADAGEHRLSSATATQVQGILEAAQTTAAEIEREAAEDARSKREEALRRAQAQVQAVEQAAAALLQRLESMDAELNVMLQSVRAGAVETESLAPPAPAPAPASAPVVVPAPLAATAPVPASPTLPPVSPPATAPRTDASERGGDDLDGARLVALNMALNGEPREQTDRYLADSFQLTDRAKLLDEVYAAVEG